MTPPRGIMGSGRGGRRPPQLGPYEFGAQRVPQPSVGERRTVDIGHPNLIVKVKILQSKKQTNKKEN